MRQIVQIVHNRLPDGFVRVDEFLTFGLHIVHADLVVAYDAGDFRADVHGIILLGFGGKELNVVVQLGVTMLLGGVVAIVVYGEYGITFSSNKFIYFDF